MSCRAVFGALLLTVVANCATAAADNDARQAIQDFRNQIARHERFTAKRIAALEYAVADLQTQLRGKPFGLVNGRRLKNYDDPEEGFSLLSALSRFLGDSLASEASSQRLRGSLR